MGRYPSQLGEPPKALLALVCLSLASAFVGCIAPEAPVGPVVLDANGATAEVNYEDLGLVLSKAVNDKGYVDYADLQKHAARLEAQLKRLAVAGPAATPTLFPTPADRLAYWYNARAAWAMRLALDANCPWGSLAPSRLEERPFPLDGRPMTLDAIDAILLREAGWQAAVGAPCVRLHRARLPERPFSPADVLEVVPRRFMEYLADGSRFVVDVSRQTVFYPPMLWAQRERLRGEYDRAYGTREATLMTALLPFTSGMAERRLQNAIGYAEACDGRDGPLACLKHP